MENIQLKPSIIAKMLKHAQKIVEGRVKLNYTDESISALDKFINVVHQEYITEETHNEESLSGICLSLGIYIGECLKRTTKEEKLHWWYGTPSTGGPQTPFLRTGDNEVYPIDWVAKQITTGKKESIAKKYKLHSQKIASLAD